MTPRRTARPQGWGRLLDDFEASQQARGRSLRTIEHYRAVLERVLLPFAAREGVGPTDITRRHLEQLAAELHARGLARQSIKTYVMCVNVFLGWCAAEREVGRDLKAPLPTVERKVLEVLTRSEIQAMEDAAVNERDRLIVRVLADAGVRLSELQRLQVDDLVVAGRERFLHVRSTKTRRERLVPIVPSLYLRLDRFIRRTRPECGTEALFVTLGHSRTTGDYEPLSQRSIEGLVNYLARKAGIKRRVHVHLFRHSLATHLLRRGTNPIQVRDILGHTSLAMIDRVYSHLTVSDAHKALMDALRAEE
jgi:integrase/recombinase XerD